MRTDNITIHVKTLDVKEEANGIAIVFGGDGGMVTGIVPKIELVQQLIRKLEEKVAEMDKKEAATCKDIEIEIRVGDEVLAGKGVEEVADVITALENYFPQFIIGWVGYYLDLEFDDFSSFKAWKKANLPDFIQHLNDLMRPYQGEAHDIDYETLEYYKLDLKSKDYLVYSLEEHIEVTFNGKKFEGEAREVLQRLIEEVNAQDCMYLVAMVFEATGDFERDALLALYATDETSIQDVFWDMITDSLPGNKEENYE